MTLFTTRSAVGITLALALAVGTGATAQDTAGNTLSAAQSDPETLGWMQGFPPPDDKTIRFTDPDYFAFPKLRWTVCHFRQLMPNTAVMRGNGAVRALDTTIDTALGDVTFTVSGTQDTMSVDEAFEANFSDGMIVLHEGRIVYERYAGCLDRDVLHGAMSMTKSLTGLLGEVLIADGLLDEDARVGALIPELEDSAFADASVRQVMDMTTSLDYSEEYADPNADVWVYAEAGSPLPKPDGYEGPRSYFEFLETVRPDPATPHGMAFGYKTVNADALGWLIARATGKSVAENLAERIWGPIGAAREGFYTVDSIGTPFAGGGFNATLQDMARLGQLMLDEGTVAGEQVVPTAAIQSIRGGGDQAAFALSDHPDLVGWSYRSMWWITENEHRAYAARGVHGQTVYVDPTADMVIARFASHPVAANAANDATSLPAWQAIAEYLMTARKPDSASTSTADATSLVGGEWLVEDIAGGGVIDNTHASLRFADDGTLSGMATCNRLSGAWQVEGDAATAGRNLSFARVGTTRRSCPPALMDQEAKMLDALEKIERFELDDTGALLLLSAGDELMIKARRH